MQFNLEHQYQLYLQRMALSENAMHPQQKVQLRQTFFGATGQMLILLKDEVSKLEDKEATGIMQDLLNQVVDFFSDEAKKQKTRPLFE